MVRSTGCRPKKKDREEFEQLKALLSECSKSEWQRAQCIFNDMTALCNAKGPTGGLMVPRACRACGYYGHSSQHCPHAAFRLQEQLRRENAKYKYLTEDECTPEHWQYIKRLEVLKTKQDLWRALDRACKVHEPSCAAEMHVDCQCQDCKDWRVFVHEPEPQASARICAAPR